MNGLRAYQTGSVALGSVAHVKRIAVRQVRRDVAGVSDRNIWAFLTQLDVISVVFESVRKQTGSALSTPRDGSKQHGNPPREIKPRPFYKPQAERVSGLTVEICAPFFACRIVQSSPQPSEAKACYSRD
jgi:hypothetical protein